MSALLPLGWRARGSDFPNVHQTAIGPCFAAGPCADAQLVGGMSVDPMCHHVLGPVSGGYLYYIPRSWNRLG
jgi:hypothetical protein